MQTRNTPKKAVVIPKKKSVAKKVTKPLKKKAIPKKHVIIYSSDSDDSDKTHSSDSDHEPESASDEEDNPYFPKHLADMGEGVIISVPDIPKKLSKNKWFKKDGKVIELDEESINDIKNMIMAIVMFFAEWCPHCQHMKPVFEEVAMASPIQCYAIDCESYPTLSNNYNIEGFPTILILKNGIIPPFMTKDNSYIYPGGPNMDSLKQWIGESKTRLSYHKPNKISKPLSLETKFVHLNGIKQFMGIEQGDLFKDTNVHELEPVSLDTLIKKNKPFLIMFFAPWCGHCINAKDMYKGLAKKMDVYALNADAYGDTANKYGVSGFPTFGMMVNGELKKYTGPRTEEGLIEFTKIITTESVIHITSLDDLRKMEAVITMFYAPWCGHCTHFKPTFIELSKEHTIPFAMVNCDELPDAKSEFNIKGFPTIHKLGFGKIESTFSISPRNKDTVSDWIKHT